MQRAQTQLRRSNTPAKRRPKRPSTRSTEAYDEARTMAFRRAGGRCECGCGRPAQDPHHIFDEQHFPELVDEVDNIICINRICHSRHTNAFKRLPRYAVRRAERLATDERMRAYLEKHYDPRPLP